MSVTIRCPVCEGTGRVPDWSDHASDQGELTNECPVSGCVGGKLMEATCSQCDVTHSFPEDEDSPALRVSDFGGVSYTCGRCRE